MTKKPNRTKKSVTLYLNPRQHAAVLELLDGTSLTFSGLVETLLDSVLSAEMSNTVKVTAAGKIPTEAEIYEAFGRQMAQLSRSLDGSLERLKLAESEEKPG